MDRGARLVVGIDLGTTHAVLAYADPKASGAPQVFPVPQQVGPAEVDDLPLLASLLYRPLASEEVADPFGDGLWILGEHAARRAAEVPGRAVVSSKSWLCHPGVERRAAILPWRPRGEDDDDADLKRISPVEAARRVLSHLRVTWDRGFPEHPLSQQHVVLTVPASFDEVARELTVEAASQAGLTVRLLEEPQAAFYDLLAQAGMDTLNPLLEGGKSSALVLVCDTGGGTTDLSLLRVERAEGSGLPTITRLAVGNHLLLGGDNMDLALAHLAEPSLVTPTADDPKPRLDPLQFGQLVAACRRAKERLLGPDAPEETTVTVLARGSRLFAAARSTSLRRDDVERLVIDGFFPTVEPGARPHRAKSGLIAFGLPYERDVAITRHISGFFARHAGEARGPDALLLNGGVFRSPRLTDRLTQVVSQWAGAPVHVLPHASPDLAVARGAVAYGLALSGRGPLIQGGAARGYYLGIAGEKGARKALCLVPRGAREGDRHVASELPLDLVVGRPVRFDLYARDDATDRTGDVVDIDDEHFDSLPKLVATLPAPDGGSSGAKAALKTVPVTLEGELSSIGTLDLACVERVANGPGRRHRLAFDLRAEAPEPTSLPPAPALPLGKIAEATDLFERVFGKARGTAEPKEVKNLLRDLEKLFGERAKWTTELSRALFDALMPRSRGRRRSPDHERVFFQIAGYCLRPGFGDPHDPARIDQFSTLWVERATFQEVRVYEQVWIAWRRVSAGLSEDLQTAIRDLADPFLAPPEAHIKKPKGFRPDALPQLLELATCLERVDPARKIELGNWILEKTWTDRDPALYAALGRLGAREPAYGSVHHVISPRTAERWIDHLLREKWEPAERYVRIAVALGRMTDDRARDVSPRVRADLEKRLLAVGAREDDLRALREFVPVAETERAAFFGDSLPVGLRLSAR